MLPNVARPFFKKSSQGREGTEHGPTGLNLSRPQQTETKLKRKALPPSRVPSHGSPFTFLLPLIIHTHYHWSHHTLILWECLFSQTYQIFPPACCNREVFFLFSMSALVNSPIEQGSPQAFTYPRHIPLCSLQQHQEEKWFRTRSWLQAVIPP